MDGTAEDRVVASGAWGTIEWAVCANGKMLAKEFHDGLSESRKAVFLALFQRMADHGRIHNREKFRKVEGDIYEFKKYQHRIGCFRERQTWFLTHGFVKKSDRWLPQEIERANRIRTEHLAGQSRRQRG